MDYHFCFVTFVVYSFSQEEGRANPIRHQMILLVVERDAS